MSHPTYTEAKRLARGLAEGKNIRDRRRDGQELCSMLGRSETRRLLAIEANGRPEALRETWRLLTNYVITGLQDMHSRKSKLVADDVRILKRFLEACTSATEGFESELSTAKLTKKEVRLVIQFVLDLLDEVHDGKNDKIEYELALLELLSQLCSAREYVAHFRPQNDMRVILEVAERRFDQDKPSVVVVAAQIVHRLLATAVSLQISLDNLLLGYVKVVANWCRAKHGSEDQSLGELEHIIGGLVILLNASPEQAIGPMTRHGAVILKFAKRRYGGQAIRQNHKDREALNDYFMAHIHVNQVAGRLQGLHPGDLGDLGPATLTEKHLTVLLEAAMHICTVAEIKDSNKSSKNNKTDFPLNKTIHKQQLRVTIRILACLQRLVIADAEWFCDESDHDEDGRAQKAIDRLIATLPQRRRPDREYLALEIANVESSCALEAYARSPFCKHILKPLYAASRNATQIKLTGDEAFPSHSSTDGEAGSAPLLDAIAKASVTVNECATIPLLQLICAAVEAFPAGDCWVSSSHRCRWHRLPAAPDKGIGPLTVLASSPDDLAAIVQTIGGILKTCGASNGTESLQQWALVALYKLADATSAMSYLCRREAESLGSLEAAWQRIWSILVDPDLLYSLSTEVQKKIDRTPTVGWLVVVVLEGIIRNFCTCLASRWSQATGVKPLSFPYREQEAIWNLPIFANPRSELTPVCFELIYTTIYSNGLVEGDGDAICQNEASDKAWCLVDCGIKRRCKLLRFCMGARNAGLIDETAMPALAASMALLVHGNDFSQKSEYGWITSLSAETATEFRDNTCLFVSSKDKGTVFTNALSTTFTSLWKPSPIAEILRNGTAWSFFDELSNEFAFLKNIVLKHWISMETTSVGSYDFVSDQNASDLMKMLIKDFHPRRMPPADGSYNEFIIAADALAPTAETELDEQLLAMKVLLSVVLTRPDERSVTTLQGIGIQLVQLSTLFESRLTPLCQDEDAFMETLQLMWQITSGLVNFFALSRYGLPPSINNFVENLYAILRGLVRHDDVLPVSAFEDTEQKTRGGASQSADFLEMDDDNEAPVETSRKRILTGKEHTVRHRKRPRTVYAGGNNIQLVLPSRRALYLSSLLLLTLSPSLEDCEHACRALLRTVELSVIDRDDVQLDAAGGVVACFLLGMESVLLHEAALKTMHSACGVMASKGSIVTLSCKIIDAMRSVLPPDSSFFPFGYEYCANMVRVCDSALHGSPMSNEEATQVSRLLKGLEDDSERRHFGLRPAMRAHRLHVTIDCFLFGRECLHDELDSAFPGTFVLPSLSDASGLVRRQASLAVAAAILMMGDEDRIVESVKKFNMPLTLSRDHKQVNVAYSAWCASRDGSSNMDAGRGQYWEDAKLGATWGAFACLAAIASHATSEVHNLRILFELIELSAHRQDMQQVCFEWFDTIARSLRFESAEQLIESLTEDFLRDWIGNRGYKLTDIPIILAAPSLVRRCLNAGRFFIAADMSPGKAASNRELDSIEVQTQAVTYFIRRWHRSIIPRAMAKTISTMLKESATMERRRGFLEDSYTKEFCFVYDDAFNDDLVKSIVKKHFSDIQAFQMVLSCGNDFDKKVSIELAVLVKGLLSGQAYYEEGNRCPASALRRFLEVVGNHRLAHYQSNVFRSMYDALKSFVEAAESGGDNILKRVRSSTVELLLVSLYHLASAEAPSHLEKKYDAVSFVCDVIVDSLSHDRQDTGCIHFAFCIRSLLSLLFHSGVAFVHCRILNTLKEIVKEAIQKSKTSAHVRAEMKSVARELLAVCMHVHEANQLAVLAQCKNVSLKMEASRRRCLGLHRHAAQISSDDSWGWNEIGCAKPESLCQLTVKELTEHNQELDNQCISKMRATYEIIEKLIDDEDDEMPLRFDDNAFIGAAPPYQVELAHIEALGAVDPSYAAQTLVTRFLGTHRQPVSSIVTQLASLGEYMFVSASTPQSTPVEQRILLAQLRSLELALEPPVGDNGDQTFVASVLLVEANVVRQLGGFCEPCYPEVIRFAASRCLGKLQLEQTLNFGSIQHSAPTISQSVSSADVCDISDSLRANCFEIVLRTLRSTSQKVALVALDTAKQLLRQNERQLYERHIGDTESLSLLKSFPLDVSGNSSKFLLLTKLEQHSLFQRACRFSKCKLPSSDWCWSSDLWKCSASVEFDKWICCIVPAMIICCYGKSVTGQADTSPYFPMLARLCAMVPHVAEVAFKAIVLDLLLNDLGRHHESNKPVIKDTRIGDGDGKYNVNISSVFTTLFEAAVSMDASSHGQEKRGLLLALDTIGFLRHLTMRRFVESKSHARNKSKKPKEGAIFPLNPSRWDGVPYGTVLRVDGLLVATACLYASRPMSAIFYAEMYADNRFGGPVKALASFSLDNIAVSDDQTSTSDISGFGVDPAQPQNDNDSANGVPSKEITAYLSILKDGLASLLESESSKAISSLQTNILLQKGHDSPLLCLSLESSDDPLVQLQLIEAQSEVGSKNLTAALTASCLESLGLVGTVQAFIRGVSIDKTLTVNPSEASELREKWCESALLRMSWDSAVFEVDSSGAMLKDPPPDFSSRSLTGAGFHANMLQTMEYLFQDDFGQAGLSLLRSHKLLLEHLPVLSNRELPLANSRWSLERLVSLNKVGSVLSQSGNSSNCLHVLSYKTGRCPWPGIRGELGKGTTQYPAKFDECITELLLRGLYKHEVRERNDQGVLNVSEELFQHLWCQCSRDRHRGLHELASGALQRLFAAVKGCSTSAFDISRLRMQEACILEARGDFTGAIGLANQVIRLLKDGSTTLNATLAEALVICGDWMAQYKIQPGSTILDKFLQPGSNIAQKLYETRKDEATCQQATSSLLALGRLTCDLFEAVRARMNSADWRDQEQRIQYQENELEECEALLRDAERKMNAKSTKKSKNQFEQEIHNNKLYKSKLRREVDKLKEERLAIAGSREHYRKVALSSIARALQIASVRDTSPLTKFVYMLFSLWFAPNTDQASDAFHTAIEELERIPSFRFVSLVNQFMSRIGCEDLSKEASYEAPLRRIILKMCRDHPFHCLHHIVYLSYAGEKGSPKSIAAKHFRTALREDDKTFRLLGTYTIVVHAYMHLADATIEKAKSIRGVSVPFSKIGKPADRLDSCLEGVPIKDRPCVLTKPPRLRPLADYGDLRDDPTTDLILGFEREFMIAEGGMNVPKVVNCVGTRQNRYKQLVKGKDEIRQDAVMQQLFGYINELLKRRHELPGTQNRGNTSLRMELLRLVTYCIVPLSPLCGVLEWVEDTVAFNDFIVDSGKGKAAGAHSRYYPGEWPSQFCRSYLEKESGDKVKAFKEIYRHHSPCFRYFFIEKFSHQIDEWHAARLRYARSVAVNSIVGHVLGIGDRHSSNILVHQKSAELVHIDFGIVFEQGRLLRTPERVPFRLTQNIVDGLGATGVEGSFTKTAETTMRVLKYNSSALLTILTSIAADPLYMWTLSPVKARAKQLAREIPDDDDDDDDKVDNGDHGHAELAVDVLKEKHEKEKVEEAMNDMKRNDQATHIIAKIQQKLQGYEEGTSGEQQGVEGQTQLLINQARDIENLALMYPGWAPWL